MIRPKVNQRNEIRFRRNNLLKRKFVSVLFALVLVLSFSLVTAVPVKAATTRNVPNPYATIQAAIDAASPGDTINVATGNYSENVVVDRQLTIRGAGSASTNVTAANANSPVFNVTANSTRIQDFTIKGATGSSGVLLQASSCAIRSNRITGNQVGIRIEGTVDNRIYRNTITGNTLYGLHLPGIGTGSNSPSYNDITGNGYGAYADETPGSPTRWQGASWNWWGDASGPGGEGPGTGNNVTRVSHSPWLNVPISTALASGVADVSISVRLQVGWNTLSTAFELAGDSNEWSEIVDRSSLTYVEAYMYDPDTGWAQLSTTSTTNLRPLDAVLIKMSSSATVSMKVSIAHTPPVTKVLKHGWNFFGAAMPFDKTELEMWKVLISVANTSIGLVGYNMVVSPPVVGQSSWIYVRGEEQETDFTWQKMDRGRGYWIYMENQDELAGFTSTPLAFRPWD